MPLVPLRTRDPRVQAPGVEDLQLDALAELGAIRELLREYVVQSAGEVIALARRVVLTPAQNVVEWVSEGGQFHAVKIDNPSAVAIEVQFASSGNPIAEESDERVPPRTGRVLTRPFDVVSIGIDPAVVPAGRTILYVTYYSRPLPPTTYAFAP